MKTTKLNPAVAALANKIAKAITKIRDGEHATRIALKVGQWPDNERDMGGLCFSALEEAIADTLQANGIKPPND